MRLLIFFLLLFTLNGCATTGAANNLFSILKPVSPEISLQNIQLMKVNLSEQTYRLRLHIKNPNSFALPLQSLNYELFLNNQSFVKGANRKAVTIPAMGDGYLETDVNSNIASVIQGWQQWFSLAKRTLDYRIVGDIGVSNLGISIPFQYADKVDLLIKQ